MASPATTAEQFNSAVAVAVRPLGSVPHDGLVLPLVSPDGRFLATQVGDPPTWPTLLAQPGAEPPVGLSLEIYDLTATPPRRVEPMEPFPPGLILGRAVDARGFLVESTRPDGARAAGRVSWTTGALEWLTAGDARDVNASFVIARAGEVSAFVSRAITVAESSLHVRSPQQVARLQEAGVSYLFPMFNPDGSRVFAFALSQVGMELVALNSSEGASGRIVARRLLSSARDPWLAYQASVAAQAAPPSRKAAPGSGPGGGSALGDETERLLLFFHPGASRMAVFDPGDASVTPLAQGSIAGCWVADARGSIVLLTTKQGLVAQRIQRRDGNWRASLPVRTLAEPWVPRATSDPERPVVLIGPGPGSEPNSLRVAWMSLVDPEPAEPGP